MIFSLHHRLNALWTWRSFISNIYAQKIIFEHLLQVAFMEYF